MDNSGTYQHSINKIISVIHIFIIASHNAHMLKCEYIKTRYRFISNHSTCLFAFVPKRIWFSRHLGRRNSNLMNNFIEWYDILWLSIEFIFSYCLPVYQESEEKMSKELKTQWHPAFVSAMQLELKEDAQYLNFTSEHNLNT